MTPHRRSRPVSILLTCAALTLAVAGCNSSSSTSTPSSSTASAGPSTTVATSYDDIAALAKALNDHGVPCVLSYPGLKDDASQAELSICTIDNEQAFLRVWKDPALVQKFLASPDGQTGTVAVGSNWMISLQSPTVAGKVAAAIGGSAPGVSGATPGSTP